jgi:hypothetical protein
VSFFNKVPSLRNTFYPPVHNLADAPLDLLFHCLSSYTNWSPTPVFITDDSSSVPKSFHPSIHSPLTQPFHPSIHSPLTQPFHPSIHSPLTQTTVSTLNLHSSVDFRRFHTLWPQKKTNNASLLFPSASRQWSGHVVWAIAQAHTAQSLQPLYGILLRSHFVSRNKIFHCAYFSIHFRIKFLLFNDFLMYVYLTWW